MSRYGALRFLNFGLRFGRLCLLCMELDVVRQISPFIEKLSFKF